MAKQQPSRKGSRGATGKTGKTGATGPAGPAGPKMHRSDVLAMVEDQFSDLRRQLDTQLIRMGQIQQQLDLIHEAIKRLIRQDAGAN